MSGEVGGVHRAEVSGVSGGLSRLPEALWRWVGVYPHDERRLYLVLSVLSRA